MDEITVRMLKVTDKASGKTHSYADTYEILLTETTRDTATNHNLKRTRLIGYCGPKHNRIIINGDISQSEVERVKSAVAAELDDDIEREMLFRIPKAEGVLGYKKPIRGADGR